MDLDHPRVVEARQRARLSLEALQALWFSVRVEEELDRDLPTGDRVSGQVDSAEGAST